VQYLDTRPATDWLPRGSRELVTFLVIAVAMVLRGNTLPTRGSLRVGRLPASPAIRHPQMSIAGFAAFSLTVVNDRLGVPFPFAPLLAALAATALGVIVGLPAVRVRGVNLAVITLSLALVVDRMVLNNSTLTQHDGRPLQADPPELFGIGVGPFHSFFIGDDDIPTPTFGVLVLVLTVAVAFGVANLRGSTTGRRMLAVRSNEAAAAAAGVNVVRTKLTAFAIASFVAGLAGALLAYQTGGRLSPPGFAAFQSLNLLAVAYLGGIASFGGAVFAGLTILGGVVTIFSEKIVHVGPWQELAGGLGLVFVAVMHPTGMAGALRDAVSSRRRRRARRVEPLPPPATVPIDGTTVLRSVDVSAREARLPEMTEPLA
jgi:branched-chain amino acid transport system permease protein